MTLEEIADALEREPDKRKVAVLMLEAAQIRVGPAPQPFVALLKLEAYVEAALRLVPFRYTSRRVQLLDGGRWCVAIFDADGLGHTATALSEGAALAACAIRAWKRKD